jgi:outer membrane protein insertion porin family
MTTAGASAQQPAASDGLRVDSLAVVGNRRVTRASILNIAAIQPGQTITRLDAQSAEKALWATGDFRDIRVLAVDAGTPASPRTVLVFDVIEQPLLRDVQIRGLQNLSSRRVQDSTGLRGNIPYSPQLVARASAFTRSALSRVGIPFARIEPRLQYLPDDSTIADLFIDVEEGGRVSVANLTFVGNENIETDVLVGAMETKPEAFWWFRTGTFDPERWERDLRDNLPRLYSTRGYLDFRVLYDTLIVDPETGKARTEIHVDEGPQYVVAELAIEGNQYFPRERIEAFFESAGGGLLSTLGIGGGESTELIGQPYNAVAFEAALSQIRAAYANEGYIWANTVPSIEKRASVGPGQPPTVRVGLAVQEGAPAYVNSVKIEGNDYTHERVIRDRISVLPGDVYSQARVLESYQAINGLGFFESPLPIPDIIPDETTGLVDITFKVKEKQTGSVNFGTTVGGGTGLSGFIGYDHPNLFGQAKEGHLRWDFGRYMNSFSLTYTDPSLRQSLVSGTASLFNSMDRFIQFQNGYRRRVGGSLGFGFPVSSDNRSRVFLSYTISRTKLTLREGVEDLSLFGQADGVLSQVQLGITRNTLNHPLFPYAGSRMSWNVDLNGGILGGDGDFTKHSLESTWWVPVGSFGGQGGVGGARIALGMSIKAGAVLGDASRFPFDRFWMGGVQFGQPLRGYDETSVTPVGFFPENAIGISDAQRLGDAFISSTTELALRMSDMISASAFFDAGNIWSSPRDIDPSRLFRGAGVGVQIVTPFGPIGVDYAYGFDKTVPGWQLHFKMGPGY